MHLESEGTPLRFWCVNLVSIGNRTDHIRLCTSASDSYRRHPVSLAQCAATLDHITKGRVALGLGAGEAMNLVPFGIKWEKPLTRLREAMIVISKLFEATPENPANFTGEVFSLRDAYLQIRPYQRARIPMYVGALGPKTRELAGELGHGFFPWIESPETLRSHLTDVDRGLKKSGREIREIDVVVKASTAVCEDHEQALKAVHDLSMDLVLERSVAKQLGHETKLPKDATIQQITPRSGYVDIVHDAMNQIPQEVLEKITVIGTVDECINKIERYLEAGATSISIRNCGPIIQRTYEIYRDRIIPYFREQYGVSF